MAIEINNFELNMLPEKYKALIVGKVATGKSTLLEKLLPTNSKADIFSDDPYEKGNFISSLDKFECNNNYFLVSENAKSVEKKYSIDYDYIFMFRLNNYDIKLIHDRYFFKKYSLRDFEHIINEIWKTTFACVVFNTKNLNLYYF